MTFASTYSILLQKVFTQGVFEFNSRTSTKIKVHPGGYSFLIDLSEGFLPLITLRKTFPKSAAAEVAWFLSGSQDVSWLKKYAPLWNDFTEEGTTQVLNSYGHRWRVHFGRDQIQEALTLLQEDPSSRQVCVSAWDPRIDGLKGPKVKNIPCPTHFTFSILNRTLHSSLFLRSSDIFVGLPYDVMGHALLMDAFVWELGGLSLGTLHVTLAHAHLYEAHWEMTEAALFKNFSGTLAIPFPKFGVTKILQNPDYYVQCIKESCEKVSWPELNLKPKIIL